jgi:hypothetical protein
MFRENEFGIFGKGAILLLLGLIAVSSAKNIYLGTAPTPIIFLTCVVGLLLFLLAKASVIISGHRISFGSGNMSILWETYTVLDIG